MARGCGIVGHQTRGAEMHKLIQEFNRSRTEAAAVRLLAYIEKHPMATCTASQCDMSIIEIATKLVKGK